MKDCSKKCFDWNCLKAEGGEGDTKERNEREGKMCGEHRSGKMTCVCVCVGGGGDNINNNSSINTLTIILCYIHSEIPGAL